MKTETLWSRFLRLLYLLFTLGLIKGLIGMAVGLGLGYGLVLAVVGTIRELLGAGSLLDKPVFVTTANGGWYEPVGLFRLAPSAFFIIGLLIWAGHRFARTDDEPRKGQR